MTHARRQTLLSIGLILLVGAGLYGLLPQLGTFHQSVQFLERASVTYVAAALGAILLSYGLAAGTYYVLALKPLRYGNTVLVELAGLLVNRVLPAGIGGLGLNYRYLRRQKHSQVAASTVVTFNNLLGFAGHATLAIGFLCFAPTAYKSLHINHSVVLGLAIAALLVVLILVILRSKAAGSLRRFRLQLQQALGAYRQQPFKVVTGLLISILMTLSSVLCLWLCCRAVALNVSLISVFIVFTFGVAAGTATPTPGGLGAVEAGLVAGFVASKVPAVNALAAVLVFRLLSFWLGLVIGALALVIVRHRRLI